MYNDKIVKGCETCFENEDNNLSSKRIEYKVYDNLKTKKNPKIIELDLSNFCNLKCIMCDANRSSQWAKTLNFNGISKTPKQFIEAIGALSNDLEQLIIQGGEPSIMKEYELYFEILEKKNIISNVHISVITNLTNINTKFYGLLKKFKSVNLSVSIDAYGKINDYIRWPSKFKKIDSNLLQICKNKDYQNISTINIMNTINILSLFDYSSFLEWAYRMEKICNENNKVFQIYNAPVNSPSFLDPIIAPIKLKEKFITDLKTFFKQNNLGQRQRFRSNITLYARYLKNSTISNEKMSRFRNEIDNMDKERNTNISKFIPNFHQYI
jgi:organic radical activating enzyme